MSGSLRAQKAPQRQPHSRRSEHDRARERDSGALLGRRLNGLAALSLFRALENVVSGLDLSKLHLRFFVALLEVRVMFLGETAVSVAYVLELDVALQSENGESTHLIAASRAVTRTCPFPLR